MSAPGERLLEASMNTPWLPNGVPHPADQLLTQRIRVYDKASGRVYPCLRDLTRSEERRDRCIRALAVAAVLIAVAVAAVAIAAVSR